MDKLPVTAFIVADYHWTPFPDALMKDDLSPFVTWSINWEGTEIQSNSLILRGELLYK